VFSVGLLVFFILFRKALISWDIQKFRGAEAHAQEWTATLLSLLFFVSLASPCRNLQNGDDKH
jgi:hypothetical protein